MSYAILRHYKADEGDGGYPTESVLRDNVEQHLPRCPACQEALKEVIVQGVQRTMVPEKHVYGGLNRRMDRGNT
jgi:hypothetical protein